MKKLSKDSVQIVQKMIRSCKTETDFFNLLNDTMFSVFEPPAQPQSLADTLSFLKAATEATGMILAEMEKRFDLDVSELVTDDRAEPASGRKTFRQWNREMVILLNKEFLESIICSACPYCEDKSGVQSYIPCQLVDGKISGLPAIWDCLITSETTCVMSREDFLAMMEKGKGKEAREAYEVRERELVHLHAQEIVQANQGRTAKGKLPALSEMDEDIRFFVRYGFKEELETYAAAILRVYPGALSSINIALESLDQAPLTV
jgi:hypothetical protein